jgi:hypothetical protein
MAVSIKASLFLPVIAVLAFMTGYPVREQFIARLRTALSRWAVPTAAAAGVFIVILLAHRMTLTASTIDAPVEYAGAVAHKTLVSSWIPIKWIHFRSLLDENLGTAMMIVIGAVLALVRRRWDVAACALGLLPLLIYRNAFPYFYVVMLAPAAVLAALVVDELRAAARRRPGASRIDWIPLVVALPLMFQAFVHLSWLQQDGQAVQRATIAAVHEIFPRPVPYLDHSGMIASFRKVNLFMGSWSMENYRAQGRGFMRQALQEHRPPLLLANRGAIDPLGASFRTLLPEDRQLIEQFYLPYWGAIWVAAGNVVVPAEGTVQMLLPFPGRYRVASKAAVIVDGVLRQNGDIVEIGGTECSIASPEGGEGAGLPLVLVTAEARQPPQEPPPSGPVYHPL